MSAEYREGFASGKQDDTNEFSNPYNPATQTQKYNDWYFGFCKARGSKPGEESVTVE